MSTNRLRIDITPPPGGGLAVETARMEGQRANRADADHHDLGSVLLGDLEGNEFRIVPPR